MGDLTTAAGVAPADGGGAGLGRRLMVRSASSLSMSRLPGSVFGLGGAAGTGVVPGPVPPFFFCGNTPESVSANNLSTSSFEWIAFFIPACA